MHNNYDCGSLKRIFETPCMLTMMNKDDNHDFSKNNYAIRIKIMIPLMMQAVKMMIIMMTIVYIHIIK